MARKPRISAVALLLAAGLTMGRVASASAADPASTSPGNVRFVKAAESSFDQYTINPTKAQIDFMQSHYARMRTYAPYFDSRVSWFPNAWTYKDMYAIYVGSSLAQQHPEWILRDASGNKLYIPWGCGGGSCPQYAGDVGNPAFRAYWISEAGNTLAHGYKGLFVDDVNMEFQVGNGSGQHVDPVDPRTGQTMSWDSWRRYVAEFTEQIKAQLPSYEIVHNAPWFTGHDDQYVQRELQAADYIELERGVNDSGIRGGTGTFGYETFMAHVDWLHARGKSVVFDAHADTTADREYGLASYFLINTGTDGLGNDPGSTPDDWWSGYDVQLGAALGGRYVWNGVLRRDFQHGVVLVNEPDATQKSLTLEKAYTDLSGQQRSSVTLGAARGAVLLGDSPSSSPPPPPTDTIVDPVSPPPSSSPPSSSPPSSGGTTKPCKKRRSCGTTSTKRRSVRIAGKVRGADSGRARLKIQKRKGNRWVAVRRTSTTVNAARSKRGGKVSGVFTKSFRGLGEGRYRVRAAYHGSPKARASVSRFRRFTVGPA